MIQRGGCTTPCCLSYLYNSVSYVRPSPLKTAFEAQIVNAVSGAAWGIHHCHVCRLRCIIGPRALNFFFKFSLRNRVTDRHHHLVLYAINTTVKISMNGGEYMIEANGGTTGEEALVNIFPWVKYLPLYVPRSSVLCDMIDGAGIYKVLP